MNRIIDYIRAISQYQAIKELSMKKFSNIIFILPLFIFSACLPCLSPIKEHASRLLPQPTLYWDWQAINIKQDNFLNTLKSKFPSNFLWGVADSEYQVAGSVYYDEHGNQQHCNNNWTAWQNTPGKIHGGQKVKQACDRWKLYKEDIQLMKDCGFKIYRFSVEWSKLEPEEGKFNEHVMQYYIEYVNELNKQGIIPVVCLFHHTWPDWFDAKGAWEKTENIADFVAFAEYVFEHLHDKVKIWMTINEPVGYALGAYFIGKCPPGKTAQLKLCGQVVKNFLDAHIACYKTMKAIDAQAQIGFPHVIQHVDAYHQYNPVEQLAAGYFDRLVNDVALEYFTTGEFKWVVQSSSAYAINKYLPNIRSILSAMGIIGIGNMLYEYITKNNIANKSLLTTVCAAVGYTAIKSALNNACLVYGYNPDAPACLDYIGVNNYSHSNVRIDFHKQGPDIRHDKNEKLCSNNQIIYPEGLYRAIARCATVGKPMYVAENGIADNNDEFKQDFIRSNVYATAKAIEDGYDVRGYFYWTLMDNWEWDEGYSMKFGLYEVDFDSQTRTMYKGAQEFIEFVRNFSIE